ncbi:MAG: type IX secretion system protein PorG [Flavobacteriales bacterium]|tara:strand:- start:183 stop:1031 length:849 start_codon:yes stop_codon:yes gene_type:complete
MKNTSLKDIFTRWNTLLLAVLFIFISTTESNSQYKPNQEFGILGGTGYYIGDMNSTHFNNLRVAGGITYRKNFDRRFTFKSSALYTNVYANDENSKDLIKVNRNLKFKSDIIELSGQIEFNFLAYETGNSLYNWTPFIFTGVSIFNYNPQAEGSDGQWYDLQELGTEGQGTTSFPNRKKYSLTQLSVPFGGGVKIGVSDNFNIIVEYGLRKTFTDYIDDVSTTYVGIPSEFTNIAIELADQSIDGPQLAGIARGDETNKDWYSFSGITLSFRLQGKTKGCNY